MAAIKTFGSLLSGLLVIVLVACAKTSGPKAQRAAPAGISHIVIVIQENRSFDNVFHGYPGADTASFGYARTRKRILLKPTSFLVNFDLSHSYRDFIRDYDNGRMDGFDLESAGAFPGAEGRRTDLKYPAYAYLPKAEVEPYWELARQYTLADRMFQSNMDQSFAAHLYLIAGQAARTANVPTGRPWGCDAWPKTRVTTIRADRQAGRSIFPCFSFETLADELEAKGLSWRYYAPKIDSRVTWSKFIAARREHTLGRLKSKPDFGQLWSAFDAIAPIRYGPQWAANVISPETSVLRDVRSGDLAAVTWVVPDMKNSDHSISRSDSGPDWVASIVNAIGRSRFWKNTAIFIVWDDSGGWYDHVPPPQVDYDGLGDRVPLIVVSPFAKHGVVSHKQYEFGSILKFTENTFGLGTLAASDLRATSLYDCFDFNQSVKPFVPIATKRQFADFDRERPSLVPPDND